MGIAVPWEAAAVGRTTSALGARGRAGCGPPGGTASTALRQEKKRITALIFDCIRSNVSLCSGSLRCNPASNLTSTELISALTARAASAYSRHMKACQYQSEK